MNFTWEVKRDFLAAVNETAEEKRALVAALLLTSGTVSPSRFDFVSENERVAGYFVNLVAELYGVRTEVKEAVRDPKRERDKLTFSCAGESAARILRDCCAEYGEEGISERLCWSEACARAFVRGAFLGGGSCTLPRGGAKTGYHLEFIFPSAAVAEDFRYLLSTLELLSKSVMRGEKYVVYLKSREALSDFLSVTGARSALKTLESVSAEREESNNLNRVENCFAGNADRTAIASALQTVALGELKSSGGLETLDEHLKELACARLANPTLSLSELAETLGITKSCLSHRMRKLMEIHKKTVKTL